MKHHTSRHAKTSKQFVFIFLSLLFAVSISCGLLLGSVPRSSVLGSKSEKTEPQPSPDPTPVPQPTDAPAPLPTEVPTVADTPAPTQVPQDTVNPTPVVTSIPVLPTEAPRQNQQQQQQQQQTNQSNTSGWQFPPIIINFPSFFFPQQQNQAQEETDDHKRRSALVAPSALVDCEGPDGKHSQKTFADCQSFNRGWKNYNFGFSVLSVPRTVPVVPGRQVAPLPTPTPVRFPFIRVTTTDEEQLSPNAMQVTTIEGRPYTIVPESTIMEVSVADGTIKITAKKSNGKSSDLDPSTVSMLNSLLKSKGIELGQSGASLRISDNGVGIALSPYPLLFDLKSNALSLQTPDGVVPFGVLPVEAISKAIEEAKITVEKVTVVTLQTLDHTPVYVVRGTITRSFLGLLAVPIEKTVYVTVENKSVVKITEPPQSMLLESLTK